MATYNFEGDITNITESQLEFINNVITELGFNGSKVTFAPVGLAGDNYMASVMRITVENDSETFTMVAKIAPTDEKLRMMMNTFVVFKNEHVMYTEVLPKLLQLQLNAGVSEDEQLVFPKCYGSTVEAPNEVILLEDLKTSEYKMLDRFTSLSDNCVKSVLRNFAIFHSLSYALKHKEPEAYDVLKTSLLDIWSLMQGKPETHLYFKQLEADVLSMVEDPNVKSRIRDKVAYITDVAAKLSKTEFNNKYSVIQHGDSWTNNIMFRFEGETPNGGPIESVLIDYQTAKNGNPVCDILYLIFNCTDYATRTKHFNDWMDYYHKELDNALSNFGLKANLVYPRDILDTDVRRYGKLLFALSIILATVLTRKSEEATKMMESLGSDNITEILENTKITQSDSETVSLFKTRVLGLINSFIQYGLL